MRLKLIPKTFVCLKEGYSKKLFFGDLFAGLSVGVISFPLSLAFAIASGVSPEKGLFTAIVAGFLISFLGGSRLQIGGPTGAFVVTIYSTVERYGYEGLAVATLIAAILLILMGIARFGVILRYIPPAVIVGFTAGIGVIILSSQIKDFFGLEIEKVPPHFIEKCKVFCQFAHTWSFWPLTLALSTLFSISLFRRYLPKWPGVILVTATATFAGAYFHLPVETIGSKFGAISSVLPTPSWPHFSWDLAIQVLPDAIAIALLGAIESLLSAAVADKMGGFSHNSNLELIAQGIANFGSILFGGIPATGAIARTSANIRFGARTPFAGMIQAVVILLFMMFLTPFAAQIPLATLAGLLLFVALNMCEFKHCLDILRGRKTDATLLLLTFILTILVDLTFAVLVGVIFHLISRARLMRRA